MHPPVLPAVTRNGPPPLPEHLAQAVWRGDAMGRVCSTVIPSGHHMLDAELPGGGWPCQSMTEVLLTQSAQAEWRLLSPALAQIVKRGGSVLLIAPPHAPHLPGLHKEGLRDDRLIRIDACTPAERLWATEQALKAGCVSAVLSWLPQVRPEQIRRLHACAAQHPGPLFVFRPAKAQADSSAAPLRVLLGLGPCPHPLQVQIVKRRGPMLDQPLSLPYWPAGLTPLLPAAPLPTLSPTSSPPLTSPLSATHPATPDTHQAPPHHAALDRLATRESRALS
ncbi:MAG TPA: translesion DNA synthesis-associated protein ImuA [Aquabacterium sp.]|uniref:translesion DNA synthesis-associated protein ImuA n=1 Tax=Aquabacterium sp. TaxID=1872578 RepID=UPI002E2FECEE|nr:translesion DNA synthesis-associated protein ImuA [Aquabacterium sp.]HEX5356743.1 translesion DNA synthesis-associated protein ImuA [Aquabacterium sp.]